MLCRAWKKLTMSSREEESQSRFCLLKSWIHVSGMARMMKVLISRVEKGVGGVREMFGVAANGSKAFVEANRVKMKGFAVVDL